MRRKRIFTYICLTLKYLFAMVFPILTVAGHRMTGRYIAIALAEVILIAFVTNLLCHVKTWLGYLFNVLALLVMNVQFAVLYWGSTFISVVMLANLDSINAISGKFLVYGLSVAMVLLFSFLPVCAIPGSKKTTISLGIATGILYACVIFTGTIAYSPYRGVYTLCQQQIARSRTASNIASNMANNAANNVPGSLPGNAADDMTDHVPGNVPGNVAGDMADHVPGNIPVNATDDMADHVPGNVPGDVTDDTVNTGGNDASIFPAESEFYSQTVNDYIQKPKDLPENPNVILIFAEGMSQNIIDDPRNIMPNVAALQEGSIHFINYYNHTFATYMGLSGQLYSGYQRENYDPNYLVSIQDIFGRYGYQTSFLNTEPRNQEFSDYLAGFGFDRLITDENRVDGMADSLSDKAAYELLLETALEQNEEGTPFFLAMYSFGTHATLDGVYGKFEDDSNALLNRFYDLDVQIGTFLERFGKSPLAENTVIILTTDHATYQDADYVTAFPDYHRDTPSLDNIPLMIYYKGVTPKSYDANGRNSLDMVPTVLDFLDMSAPNGFLGDSLFTPDSTSPYDTYFESMGTYYCTAGGEIRLLSAQQLQDFEKQLAKYYAAKLCDDLIYAAYEEEAHVYATVRDDQAAIVTELYHAEAWDTIRYAVWSEENGQDDLLWFTAQGNHESYFTHDIELTDYDAAGVYYIHVYGSADEGAPAFIGETKVYVGSEEHSDDLLSEQ